MSYPYPAPAPQKSPNAWLKWVFFGIGLVSFVGFVMAALKVPTRRFVTAAIVAMVATAIGFGAYVMWPPTETAGDASDPNVATDFSSYNGLWVQVAVWALLAIYALALFPGYSKAVRGQEAEQRWLNPTGPAAPRFTPQPGPPRVRTPPPRSPSAPRPGPSPSPPVERAVVEADRYFATQPGGNMPAEVPPNAPQITDTSS